MNVTKKFVCLALSGAMCLSLAACGGSGGSTTAEGAAVYRELYSNEVTTLNYLTTSLTNEYKIGANVVDCLVEYDSYGNIIPSLAESWESNEDMTQWTFHIRQGVKWVDKDGNEVADVTANDWVSTAHYVNDAHNSADNQYMYSTGAVVHNAQAYYDYTAYLLTLETLGLATGENAVDDTVEPIEVVDPVEADSIGVQAVDDYTLVYTLDQPCPFFLSVLSYTSYMPVYGPFLEECGDQFGLDNENLLYNGAFILSSYLPQQERILTKNQSYWDKDNVFIDEIRQIYNAEAINVSVSMYQADESDYAAVPSDLLDAMLADESTASLVHGSRPDVSFSYFYSFNFDPHFDEQYEPENWKIAVNNENFRKAVMAALDRVKALTVSEPYNPSDLLNNTITPANFAVGDGKDYTQYDALVSYTEGDSFDAAKAVEYRDAAKAELTAAGATFPIKVLMPYNPSTANWDKECQVVEQQIEGVLGTDFIDIIVQAGPETGFLSAVRRSGDYALMKCNWGADYADPQTWTEPFVDTNTYGYWNLSEDPNTQALFAEYMAKVEEAKSIYNDDAARYTAFAEAEALLIEHAIAIPFSVSSGDGYIICDLNPLEGEYAPYGVALQRYKYQKLYDTSMSMEEFETAYAAWKESRAQAIAAAAE